MNSRPAAGRSCWLRFALIVCTILNAFRAAALDGAVDQTYHPPFLNPIPDVIVLQPDGKSLVSFGSAGGTVGLMRLGTNGSADATFNTGKGPLIITPPIDVGTVHIPGATNAGSITTVALQSGGRVIVGGNFSYFDDTTKPRSVLVRLSSNGVVDATFTTGNLLTGGQGGTVVQAVAVDDTDRIYVGGKFTKVNNVNRSTSLIRLKADGTLDSTFADVVLAGLGSASIEGITIQPDHKVLVTTTYFSASVQATLQILRLMPNGGLDPTFQKGTGQTAGTAGLRHLLLPNGQIIVTIPPKDGLTYNGVAITGSLFRLSADGVVDPNFKSLLLKFGNAGLPAFRMAAAKDGRVYVSGGFAQAGNVNQSGIIRLLADGNVDPAFVPVAAAGGIGGMALAVQPDGKVIVQNSIFDGALKYGVVRLLVGDAGVAAPKITVQPVGATVATGAQTVFSVTATGVDLSYKWTRGNVEVPGATGQTLTINPATAANAGEYRVTVTNNGGSVTSDPAPLVVLDPPHITVAPQGRTVIAGFEVVFSVVATGAPTLTYQWFKDNQPIAGATSDIFRILKATAQDAGKFSVKVSNAVGNETSAQVELVINVPPTISPQPSSQTIVLPPDLAGPCDGLTGANLPGHTLNLKINSGLPPFAASGNFQVILAASGGTYTIPASGAIPASAGSWSFGADLGVKTVLTLGHYFANGNAAKLALLPDCTYELYADGIGTSQGGTFSVTPAITFPPVNVSFVSGATGTGPFTFQWRHNGLPIQGANGAQLNLQNVHRSDLGQYTLFVSGPGGTVESQVATLAEAIAIVQPTLTFQVLGGTTLHFTIPVGFHLERSSSLSPPAWNTVPVTGTVDVPISGAGAYFRLATP